MNIASLILFPGFQIYVRHEYGAQLYYADVYKLQYIRLGTQPGIFYCTGGFGEKGHNICKVL